MLDGKKGGAEREREREGGQEVDQGASQRPHWKFRGSEPQVGLGGERGLKSTFI